MEGKIVAATFTTLALVFAGMSGGSVNADVDQVLPSDDSPVNDFTSSFQIVDSLFENPETEHHVTMAITLSESHEINIDTDKMEVENLKSIEGTTQINSNEDITLIGFNGNVNMDNETEILGSAQGAKNTQMNITTPLAIDRTIETDEIKAEGIERNAFEIGAEEIVLESNETSSTIDQSNTIVEITSFSGKITFRPPDRIYLDGEVAEVHSGTTTFGG